MTETEAFVGDFLKHFGIRGMHWGVRKSDSSSSSTSSSGSNHHGISEDAALAGALAMRVKMGGTKSLSNRELQTIVNRMNLEQNFARINTPEAKKKSPIVTGIEWFANQGQKYGGVMADMYVREQLKSVSKRAPQLVSIPVKK